MEAEIHRRATDELLGRAEDYARLARRFLEAYGPATPRDLAYWGKVKITEARFGFEAVGVEVETSRGRMWALSDRLESAPDPDGPVVHLLPTWENYLLGYADRTLAVPEPHDRVRGAGRPAATVDGLAFGHWRIERGHEPTAVVIEPFGKLPRGARPGIERETAAIGRFLGTEAAARVDSSSS